MFRTAATLTGRRRCDTALQHRARLCAVVRAVPRRRAAGRRGADPRDAVRERCARKIAPPSAKSSAEIEGLHPPIGVFEDFIKGLLAETPATAINYLNDALARQPTFDRARLALWEVYTDEGDYERALAAAAA